MDISREDLTEAEACTLATTLFGSDGYKKLYRRSWHSVGYLNYALFRENDEINLDVSFTGRKDIDGIMKYKLEGATNVEKLTNDYELIEAGA